MISGLKSRSLLFSIKVRNYSNFADVAQFAFTASVSISFQSTGLARSALRSSGCRAFHFKIEGRRSQDGTAKGQVWKKLFFFGNYFVNLRIYRAMTMAKLQRQSYMISLCNRTWYLRCRLRFRATCHDVTAQRNHFCLLGINVYWLYNKYLNLNKCVGFFLFDRIFDTKTFNSTMRIAWQQFRLAVTLYCGSLIFNFVIEPEKKSQVSIILASMLKMFFLRVF